MHDISMWNGRETEEWKASIAVLKERHGALIGDQT